MDKLMLLV